MKMKNPHSNNKRRTTLKRKLIKYFLIIISLMFLLTVYITYGFKTFYQDVSVMLRQLVDTHSISMEIERLYDDIDNYAHSGNDVYLKQYQKRYYSLIARITQLMKDSEEEGYYYKYKDIRNMVITFSEICNKVKQSFLNQQPQIYINQIVIELHRLKGYINDEVKNLLFTQLIDIESYYSGFGIRLGNREYLVYAVTLLITLLCLGFAFKFSRDVSIPIHSLAETLKRVAKGELDVEPLEICTDDEVNILIESFNNMIYKINQLIATIKTKADIERRLKEQEIKNLEMAKLLNESELAFLQSQINPHFLFNTMNTILILADLEDAKQTKKMLESMSSILRHSIKHLETTVLLGQEYDIVMNYLYIQQVRYGNKIEYIIDVDEKALSYRVPVMILQPFIENAIIHGLEPKEGKGILELIIRDKTDKIEIIIRDNGVGIPPEKLEKIKNFDEIIKEDGRKSVGIFNVMRRLEIKYGKNVVEIYSELNKGTRVLISLDKYSSSTCFRAVDS